MTRREFRLISGQGGGPSVEDITKRPAKRRHFKTLHVGGIKTVNRIGSVTLKGIDKTDGTTVWEYGPGAYWRHHYEVDAISGVVPNTAATLNKYAIAAAAYPSYNACGNRNAATLTANVMECLEVVKLNSLDGTEIESATLTGMFCSDVRPESFALILGLSITNAAALSGGDYVIVGQRLPVIEFVDYSSNTANKEYILHAHGQQSGNVYLKTRTSSETITIPQNATAGEVETLFEATSDCVSATATGGPWPLLPISIDVEWSVSSGDISAISATDTYSAEGGLVDWDYTNGNEAEGVDYLLLTINNISIGAEFTFSFVIGDSFAYTSTTDDVATFLAALAAAMEAFAIAQGLDGVWESVASGLPDSIAVSGNTIKILYSTEIGISPMTVALTDGGDTVIDSRRAGSCAAAYDTGTGAMTSAVGYQFGYSEDRPTLKMFTEAASIPSVTGLNVLGIASIGAGPSNTIVVTPQTRGTGDNIKANVIEKWGISGGVWAFDWQVYCNATMAVQQVIPCEAGYVLCPIDAKRFDGARDRTAAKIAVSGGAITEVETTFGSLTNGSDNVRTVMFDDTHASYLSFGYDITYQSPALTNNAFRINGHGADVWVNGDELRIGATPFGTDGTDVFALRPQGISGGFNYDYIGDSSDHDIYIKFFAPHTARAAEPQQFRFVLDSMPAATNYTSWLDWYSTQSEMETALNALLGSGNCAIIDFGGEATPTQNNPQALIECNPMIRFYTDAGFSPGSGFIPATYFGFRNDGQLISGVRLEVQTVTLFTDPAGISSYSAVTADLNWSRVWGTKGAATIEQPLLAWLEGDMVYAYGNVVDSEL